MFKVLGRILVLAMSMQWILLVGVAFSQDKITNENKLISEVIMSEEELPMAVRKAWDNTNEACMAFEGDLIKAFGGIQVSISELSKYSSSVRFYLLPCGSPAAYNAPSIGIYYYPKDNIAKIASLPIIVKQRLTTQDVLLNTRWDTNKQQLISFYKGRGLGDCGASYIWDWNITNFISAFVLVEQRSKESCDGVHNEWPQVWPIALVKKAGVSMAK